MLFPQFSDRTNYLIILISVIFVIVIIFNIFNIRSEIMNIERSIVREGASLLHKAGDAERSIFGYGNEHKYHSNTVEAARKFSHGATFNHNERGTDNNILNTTRDDKHDIYLKNGITSNLNKKYDIMLPLSEQHSTYSGGLNNSNYLGVSTDNYGTVAGIHNQISEQTDVQLFKLNNH